MNISELMEVARSDRKITWLRNALQTALKLEFSTLPPYLIALWSIKERNSAAYDSIRNHIAEEEMLHMALVCNLIVAMGGDPDLTSKDGVPAYPGPLPGMVQSDLEVFLQRFSNEALQVFLAIEYPENGPIDIGNDPRGNSGLDACVPRCAKTIGEFYTDILILFKKLSERGELPEFDTNRQLEYPVDFQGETERTAFIIDSLEDVERAIGIIKRQGEGTGATPIDTGIEDLSHYYRFLEVDRERKIIDEDGSFVFSDKPEGSIPFPTMVHPMATIPKGGYLRENVPDDDVWEDIENFDRTYSTMLIQIERAWTRSPEEGGGLSSLNNSIGTMFDLAPIAVRLMNKEIPGVSGETYGPCFRFNPDVELADEEDSDPNQSPTWEDDIKGLFNDGDVACMKRRGLDLSNYQDVKTNARAILTTLESGSMPPGSPWPQDWIDTFKLWVDNGAPEGGDSPIVVDRPGWSATSAPEAGSRYDDIWFVSPEVGWAVNSEGQILHTTNGGITWTQQFRTPMIGNRAVYLRCISFASNTKGWVGTLTDSYRMFRTVDGGNIWTYVANLPNNAPLAICGLYAVNELVVYASGTNFPTKDYPTRVMKTSDGGDSWTAIEMDAQASNLIDIYFFDEQEGFVVGGYSDKDNPGYEDVVPVVLHTQDGGQTWFNRVADLTFNPGEWGWKIYFVNTKVGYVSLESFDRGAVLRTTDGGMTWIRLPINDQQGNANLEGVGFIDEDRGWVGGWGDRNFMSGYTSATFDGGLNWKDANEVGRFINRFRLIGQPVTVGYASGRRVYKYIPERDADIVAPQVLAAGVDARSRMVASSGLETFTNTAEIVVRIPEGSQHAWLNIWNRFGMEVRVLLDESNPVEGDRTIVWDGLNDAGNSVPSGIYIFRLTVDSASDSGCFHLQKKE